MTSNVEENIDNQFEKIADTITGKVKTIYETKYNTDFRGNIDVPDKEKASFFLSRINTVENTRVVLLFKNLLRSTLNQLNLGYRLTLGMYVATFLLGVVLILIGLYMAIVKQSSIFGLLFTGVGSLDILIFFFSDPPAKLEQSRNNLAMLIAPYYAWYYEVVNRHELLRRYQLDMQNMLDISGEGLGADEDLNRATFIDDIQQKINEFDKRKLTQPERKRIWDEIFEVEKIQSQVLLEDTDKFITLMLKIRPLQSGEIQKETTESKLITETTTSKILKITSIAPTSKTAGEKDFDLVVTGTGFVSGSLVHWNNNPQITTFTSSTQLTASIPAALINEAGKVQVTVVNPDKNKSEAMPFTINAEPEAPEITSIKPSEKKAGDAGFDLDVEGTGFVAGCTVHWNTTPLTPKQPISSTKLTVPISSALIAAAEKVTVTVVNPDGAISNTTTFTINQGSGN
jgi:hypothetical protein